MNDATSNSSEIIFVNFWRGISSWNKSPFTSLKMRKNARSIWQFSFWKRIWNNFVQFSLCWRHFVSVIILNYPPEITFALNNEKQRQKWCIQAKFVARVCVWSGARILFCLKIKYEYALHEMLQRNVYCSLYRKHQMNDVKRFPSFWAEHRTRAQPTNTYRCARVHVFVSTRIRCRKQ